MAFTDSERIPWDVIRSNPQFRFSMALAHVPRSVGAQKLCSELLGLLDYLFSGDGQRILEVCRSDLEELGFIWWNNEAGVVQMHSLTLSCVKKLLQRKCGILDNLVSQGKGKCTEESICNLACEGLFRWLQFMLLLQVFYRSAEVLTINKNELGHNDKAAEENWYKVSRFLEGALESCYCQEIIRRELTIVQLENFVSDISCRAFAAEKKETLLILLTKCSSLPRLIHQCFRYTPDKIAERWVDAFGLTPGVRMPSVWLSDKCTPLHKIALELAHRLSGPDSVTTALVHVVIASHVEQWDGHLRRNMYLIEASMTCLRLLEELRKDNIKNRLKLLRQRCSTQIFHFVHEAFIWANIIRFKLSEPIRQNIRLNDNTQDCTTLLISLYQELQPTIIKEINNYNAGRVSENLQQSYLSMLTCFVICALTEANLYSLLHKTGLSLRTLVKALSFVEEKFLDGQNSLGTEGERHYAWRQLVSLVEQCCCMASGIGLFSLASKCMSNFDNIWDEMLSLKDKSKTSHNHRDDQSPDKLKFIFFDINIGHQLRNNLNVLFSEGLILPHEGKHFCEGLSTFLKVLKQLVLLRSGLTDMPDLSLLAGYEVFFLQSIVIIAVLLGKEATSKVLQSLQILTDLNTTTPDVQQRIEQVISKLNMLRERSFLPNLFEHFMMARDAFEDGNFTIACQAFLQNAWQATSPSAR